MQYAHYVLKTTISFINSHATFACICAFGGILDKQVDFLSLWWKFASCHPNVLFLSFKLCDKNLHESGSKLVLLATLTLLQKKFLLFMTMEVVCKLLSIYSVTEIIG